MSLMLDPEDEFENAVMQIVEHHRVKAREYAGEEDNYENIALVAQQMNISVLDACDTLLAKHEAFLQLWRRRGEATESYIDDAYLDRAVFSVIALVLYRREYLDDAVSDGEAQLRDGT